MALVQWAAIKKKVNEEGLRLARGCQVKIDQLTMEALDKAIKKAKEEKATQLRPDHFEE